MENYKEIQKQVARETVKKITEGLNNGSLKASDFIEAMNCEHRYLQGEFFNMVYRYIENCASNNFQFDGRNEFNHTASLKMMEGAEGN